MRRCAVCGTIGKARRCPEDGFPTLRVVQGSGKAIQPGASLAGRYTVTDLIGKGGFGKVYGLSDSRTGMKMAVKVLSPAFNADSDEATRRFVREAATTSGLTHGNTVRVFDYGQTDNGQLFLVMERLQGEPLSGRLDRHRKQGKRLSEQQTVNIGMGVLSSLAEAHSHGLVHRDMKPENVFMHKLGRREIVKVLDFGIVREKGSEMTQAGQPIGTPSHMSPEQAMGRGIDARSDLYSTGIVLYECVSLRLPYERGANALMTMMQHVTGEPAPLVEVVPGLDPTLIAIIEQALAKDPDMRWQSAEAMRTALRSSAAGMSGKRRRSSQLTVSVEAEKHGGTSRTRNSHALLAERRATRLKLGRLPDDRGFMATRAAGSPKIKVNPKKKRMHHATTQRLKKEEVQAQIDDAIAAKKAAKSQGK